MVFVDTALEDGWSSNDGWPSGPVADARCWCRTADTACPKKLPTQSSAPYVKSYRLCVNATRGPPSSLARLRRTAQVCQK